MKSSYLGNAKESILNTLEELRYFFNQSFYSAFIKELKKRKTKETVNKITCLILIETNEGKIYIEPNPILENSTVVCFKKRNQKDKDFFCYTHKINKRKISEIKGTNKN